MPQQGKLELMVYNAVSFYVKIANFNFFDSLHHLSDVICCPVLNKSVK